MIKKVSVFISMYVLTIYLIQTHMRAGKQGKQAQTSANGGHTNGHKWEQARTSKWGEWAQTRHKG